MTYLRQKVLICALMVFLFTFLLEIDVRAENNMEYDTGTVTVKVLNLRQSPSPSSKILTKIKLGEKVKIIDNSKNWRKVNYKNVVGWIAGNYIKISKSQEKTGKVNVDILKVRKNPNTTAAVLSKLQKGSTFQILEVSKNWYRIRTTDGLIGWVCSDYVSLVKTAEPRKAEVTVSRGNAEENPRSTDQKVENVSNQESSGNNTNKPNSDFNSELPKSNEPGQENGGDSAANMQNQGVSEEKPPMEDKQAETTLGQQIVNYATTFAGISYKYGGNTPDEGFDCSGFTKYVFSYFNINLERTAASQAVQGMEVKKEELAVGDLLFFDTTGNGKNINHVGIYMGDNKFIHAASPAYGVTVTNITDNYYQKAYMTSRRFN